MVRIARVIGIGLPHHIMMRGNYRQEVFFDKKDYLTYLRFFAECSQAYDLTILSFCLLPTHVHFVVIPHKNDSLAKTFNIAHMKYTQYMNKKMGESGHLWQGRFSSCVFDKTYLASVLKYVERKPIREGLVANTWDWEWSSAKGHVGLEISTDLGGIKISAISEITSMSHSVWKQYLIGREREKMVARICHHTATGRPLGSDEFIETLEMNLNRKLKALPIGRPRNSK